MDDDDKCEYPPGEECSERGLNELLGRSARRMKMSEQPLCEICGEPMPESEQMFKYHGASGPCPKPPLPRAPSDKEMLDWLQARAEEGCVTMCFELDGGVHVTLDPCGGEPCAAREAETVRDGIAALMRPNTQVQP